MELEFPSKMSTSDLCVFANKVYLIIIGSFNTCVLWKVHLHRFVLVILGLGSIKIASILP